MKLLIINGPNMNMLGIREPEIYGTQLYDDMVDYICECRGGQNELSFMQSNHEGDIIDAIQQAYFDSVDGIVINPAAYSHTSIAIADAVRAVRIPTVEVHMSDIRSREEYRRHSFTSEVAVKTISGRGADGYVEAIDFLNEYLR